MPTPLVVDTDPGLDDALALTYLWQNHSIDLLTTTHGNTTVTQATTNAAYLRETTGEPTPIKQGAASPTEADQVLGEFHGDKGLGRIDPEPSKADPLHSEHIPDDPTILCLGPLTNIAHILETQSSDSPNCFILGGTTSQGNIHGEEFNFYADPHAANTVLNNAKTTLLPIDIVRHHGVSYKQAQRYETTGVPGKLWRNLQRACKDHNAPSIRPYDLIAAYLLFNEDKYSTEERAAHVSTQPQSRGALQTEPGNGVNIITRVDDGVTNEALQATLLS